MFCSSFKVLFLFFCAKICREKTPTSGRLAGKAVGMGDFARRARFQGRSIAKARHPLRRFVRLGGGSLQLRGGLHCGRRNFLDRCRHCDDDDVEWSASGARGFGVAFAAQALAAADGAAGGGAAQLARRRLPPHRRGPGSKTVCVRPAAQTGAKSRHNRSPSRACACKASAIGPNTAATSPAAKPLL